MTRRPLVPSTERHDDWWRRVWLPAARDMLRRRRRMVGSRWWPLQVLLARAVACRRPQPSMGSQLGEWRCQRHVLHGGLHRFRNYVWSGTDEHPHYDPMPIHGHGVVTW